MRPLRSLFFSSAPLLLTLLLPALALAHGHDESSDDKSSMPGMDMGSQETSGPKELTEPSYWLHPEHVAMIYTHIALAVLAWAIVMPLAIMLTIARSKLKVLAQFVFLLVNALAILTSIIYNAQTPDLYENNSHHKIGWAVTWIATAWSAMGLVTLYSDRKTGSTQQRRPLLQPVTQQAMEEYDQFHVQKPEGARWSGDSGQGTERNTNSLSQSSRSNSWNPSETGGFPMHREQASFHMPDEDEITPEERRILPSEAIDTFLAKHVPRHASGFTLKAFNISFAVLTRFQILLGFLAITTGMITFGGIARSNHVFSVLAHFIKGGIFFWYGLLTLGRWMGCFADFGWAWNIKPGAEVVGKGKARVPTAEFTESFVIWLYGVTNVFLEHLTAWGQAWSAQDLEHVSITIMFAGGGLLGMLIESTTVRKLVATSLSKPDNGGDAWREPDSYRHPLNPMPSLIILLLGKMMSSHTQHSATSGMIHGQWGSLFMLFAVARLLTYIALWLKPPTTYLPTRPPTELIASFCLISGGMIFMVSNSDSVSALESYNLDAMFVFTVMMGLTATIMAWVVMTIAFKGWAEKRVQRASFAPASSFA